MSRYGQLEARIDTHEKVCAERYDAINKGLSELKMQLANGQTQNHDRFNSLSSRMWTLLSASLGMTIAALAVLAFFLLTTRPHA